MLISRLQLQNWRNFKKIEVDLRDRVFVIGPNASGKSNLLDVFRFLRDVAKPKGGGLQRAVEMRGGMTKVRCLLARRKSDMPPGHLSHLIRHALRVQPGPVHVEKGKP